MQKNKASSKKHFTFVCVQIELNLYRELGTMLTALCEQTSATRNSVFLQRLI